MKTNSKMEKLRQVFYIIQYNIIYIIYNAIVRVTDFLMNFREINNKISTANTKVPASRWPWAICQFSVIWYGEGGCLLPYNWAGGILQNKNFSNRLNGWVRRNFQSSSPFLRLVVVKGLSYKPSNFACPTSPMLLVKGLIEISRK